MIKLTFSGTKSKKHINFKNKFSELTVEVFCAFMNRFEKVEKLIDEGTKLEQELSKINEKSDVEVTALLDIDAKLLSVDSQIRALKIEQLALLSENYSATINYLLNTPGITQKIIYKAFSKVESGFGDFSKWFDSIKSCSSFKFSDYRKTAFWKLSTITQFEVFDMTKQTVLRDAAASIVASKIDVYRTEFTENRWDNLPRFLAYICRPSVEEKEVSASKSHRKKSFFGGKEVATLSVADRLDAYNTKLAETVNLRIPVFNKLPLSIALGAYKQYFFLSPLQ